MVGRAMPISPPVSTSQPSGSVIRAACGKGSLDFNSNLFGLQQ